MEPADDRAAALLWAQADRGPRRGRRPKFALEDVVQAAILVADAEGVDAVTMQRVAEELGAAKMALYRYVPGKTELVALMLDRALGDPPSGAATDWRDATEGWAAAMRERMAARPWSVALTAQRRTPGPHETAWLEQGLVGLRATTLTGSEKLDALALLSNHVRGSVLQAAAGPDPEQAMTDALGPILAERAATYPETVAAFEATAADGRRDDGFRFGLRAILDGIAAMDRSRRNP